MKSILNCAAATLAAFAACSTQALAAVGVLPEPGSVALVGLGLGAAVYFLRKGKKK